MLKKVIRLVMGLILLSSCSLSSPTFLHQVPSKSSAKEVELPHDIMTSVYKTASEFTADYFRLSEKKNQIFSPLSLWIALGVLREGATGETLTEIDEMMKLSQDFDSSRMIPDLTQSLNFMEQPTGSKGPAESGILLTNGIFFEQRIKDNILKSYLEKTGSIWNSEAAQVDFTKKEETGEIIRHWVGDKTQGFIDDYEAAFPTDGSAILNIYNVLYLKDVWHEPFHNRGKEAFHGSAGDVTASFMGGAVPGAYHEHEKARAAAFAGETGIRVWFLLPEKGLDPMDLVPGLQEILSRRNPVTLNFKAPSIEIDGESLSLKELLMNKGYSRLFSSAELDNMLTGISASVTEIKQKTKLQMDENGFKAAAVTGMGLAGSAPSVDFVDFFVDRPYLMVIEYQGLPLFIARITDPTQS